MANIAVTVSMGVMKPLLEKLATLMGDEYKKFKGLRKEVSFLKCELSDMKAVLEKMDDADELDPQAKNWRKDIIDMSYDIEDYIDDFMSRVGEVGDNVGALQKASHYLKTFKDRRRLANQFQEIKTLVIDAGERRKRYMLDQCIPSSSTNRVIVDPRLSALYQKSASLVGIDSQKKDIVGWVMDDEGQQIKVVSIVGFGGLGKTTLANEVYREVGGSFNCKAFISISQNPDIIKLLSRLMGQLGLPPYSYACEPEDLVNILRKHLNGKRWIGHLGCLRELLIQAKQIHQEDLNVIGTRLTSLVYLRGVSCLTFETGATPDLRYLALVMHPYGWDKATPVGLQHLPSLKRITVYLLCDPDPRREEWMTEKELVRGVFQEVVDAFPTRPTLHVRIVMRSLVVIG